MNEKRRKTSLKILLALFFFWMGVTGTVAAQEKMTIGLVEDVILMPWKVKIPARIDTGASYSSLDARELIIKNRMAEFKLPRKYGGLKLRLPVVEWQTIRSAEAKERRAVVEIHLCLGNKYLRTRVNLNDRGGVKYPLLIGRNILQENFVVDCAQERCAPPICPEEPAK